MPKIKYRDIRMGAAKLAVVAQANAIIEEYEAAGYALTLRQLYYQFVARALIENTERSYKHLGCIINDARLAGLVDWDHIQDRGRFIRGNNHWQNPEQIIASCAEQFQIDKWANQRHRIEVWVEKDALLGVIESVCRELDVSYFSCRGYTSQSEMWSGAMRLKRLAETHQQQPVILHLGDHDPSGIDMSRDIAERMELFMGGVTFKRLALNMNQVEQYSPPPNPAKVTDSRYASYQGQYGEESWELDALEPVVLVMLIRQAVMRYRNASKWASQLAIEQDHRAALQFAATHWDAVEGLQDQN